MFKYIVFSLLIVSHTLPGQIKATNILTGVTYNYVCFEGFAPKNAVGINGELMLSNRFGVELSITGGEGYFSYGIASLAAPPVILLGYLTRNWDNGSGAAFIGLFLMIPALLEQTNFHIPISPSVHLVPYISTYKFKYLYENNSLNKYHYFCSGSIGTKLTFITKNNWCISANYELSKLYRGREKNEENFHSTNIYGYLFGLNISYIFRKIKL